MRMARIAILLAGLLAACGSDELVGPAAEDCDAGPYFSALPVAMADIDVVAVFGGLGAPGHTLPTAHAGIYLATEGAQVYAPGAMQITGLRRTRYLASPNRQGREDYTADFQVCRQVSGWFGHLTDLSDLVQVPDGGWTDCQQYSTAIETVELCFVRNRGVTLEAGQLLGTGGMSLALGLMGLDVGLMDTRVNNFYVMRSRHPQPTFRAICPWEPFVTTLREQLYSRLLDKSRPSLVPAGEPRCGTMEVDVAGTGKGAWVLRGVQPQPGNETTWITLANYPYRPEDHLALSLGPASLGARTVMVPRLSTGRVNRGFEHVTNDGLVYCYTGDLYYPGDSWLLGLTSPSSLSVRHVSHAPGASPCQADPATWSLTDAVQVVR
jgi:hypothetical protein